MEERIIDDDIKKNLRLKKTDDGYEEVDDDALDGEVMFEVTDLEEDDEELAGLSPEEAIEYRKRKAEEAAQRQAEYERLCKEGAELLETGSFKAAELKYEKALDLDKEAKDASVGYWRAKTADFTEPDALVEEYYEAGYENLEYDLGYDAVLEIKEKFKPVFERRMDELTGEETALNETFVEKQAERREILNARAKKAWLWFGVTFAPTFITLILAIVFGTKILSTPDGRYIAPTAVFAGVFVVVFIVFGVMTNKLLNVMRIRRANEKLSSTEDGRELLRIRAYKEIYDYLLN